MPILGTDFTDCTQSNESNNMKSAKTILSVCAAVAVAAFAMPQRAAANAVLTISDGINTPITITDNGPGDMNSAVGWVVWNGTIGVWNINLDSGLSYPLRGTLVNPEMDLSFVAGSTAAGNLTLVFTDSGFTATDQTLCNTIGGTADGTVNDYVIKNYGLQDSTLVTSITGLGPGGFNGFDSAHVSLTSSDTLSIVLRIAHPVGGGLTTGDKLLHVPDGGLTVALLGFALVGVEGLRRRLAR